MDAVKYLKEYERMCRSYGHDCNKCGINKMRNGDGCTSVINKYPEEAVSIVEKWSKEHSIKTRRSKFLKMFPNVRMESDGFPYSSPCDLDATVSCRGRTCKQCKEEYWLAAAEDEAAEEDQ